jgi:hypothetical protein
MAFSGTALPLHKYAINYCVKFILITYPVDNWIYQSVIAPVLLYGSESWPTQEEHVSRRTATEMRCYWKIVGKTKRDRVRSERIREQVGQESERRVLEERQLRWFGHVYRMERERKPNQFMEAWVEGRK